ncbi:SDR family NAD(P)-dependent oxidoreductase [Brachybacterium saurashtrense]|uniref:SDR family NAD(P)-dependent oxidoreductase n=1 Tax=Brachybacterium saurashtrense TaxID=556288 RepID=A0A345YSY9_9MICO|nr:SDR family NAD(P)-dependent oxidoreductase [Brachybacterium saurashtrense]AXK47041.1 SDR family NAD(P)-dependent oxidoreductase [Brachybacterium saurashtrense]RRR20890.1 SDR family NAD(P)-dependent oxidoreductase [Brachybacterium saurashtrense]
MELDLRDRVVVVTGAGRGIGAVIARRFAAEGAHVAALDLAHEDAATATEEATDGAGGAPDAADGTAILPVVCDVTDPDSVDAAVAQVVARHGRIDVLVNNAGIVADSTVLETDWETWRRCLDVNAGGTFLMCRAAAPHMQDSGRGRILNAASFAAIVPSVGSAAYAASKAAVVQLSRVLASELGPHGITVNSYAPGMVPTAMNGFAEMPAAQQDRLLDTLSLRRWESADDVADLLLFLASDQASYITGALLDVSGGKFATQIPAVAYGR